MVCTWGFEGESYEKWRILSITFVIRLLCNRESWVSGKSLHIRTAVEWNRELAHIGRFSRFFNFFISWTLGESSQRRFTMYMWLIISFGLFFIRHFDWSTLCINICQYYIFVWHWLNWQLLGWTVHRVVLRFRAVCASTCPCAALNINTTHT